MTIVQALTVAFQFVNQSMPDIAIAEMAHDLEAYPEAHVLAALKRCRSELKSIRYSDILDRMPGGHPGPEEAWSCVSRGMQNEAFTVLWTEEMREAYGIAAGLADDPIAARVAFKESYTKLISQARANNAAPNWSVSLGSDPHDRERTITEGIKSGRLQVEYAQRLLPYSPVVDAAVKQLLVEVSRGMPPMLAAD